jgi:hypothetical protein
MDGVNHGFMTFPLIFFQSQDHLPELFQGVFRDRQVVANGLKRWFGRMIASHRL